MSKLIDWNARLRCGKVITGKTLGLFRHIKNQHDIIDLWVKTNAGNVHAARQPGMELKGFDFFVHVCMEEKAVTEHYKLVTEYQGIKLIRHILPDGSNWIEKIKEG